MREAVDVVKERESYFKNKLLKLVFLVWLSMRICRVQMPKLVFFPQVLEVGAGSYQHDFGMLMITFTHSVVVIKSSLSCC